MEGVLLVRLPLSINQKLLLAISMAVPNTSLEDVKSVISHINLDTIVVDCQIALFLTSQNVSNAIPTILWEYKPINVSIRINSAISTIIKDSASNVLQNISCPNWKISVFLDNQDVSTMMRIDVHLVSNHSNPFIDRINVISRVV